MGDSACYAHLLDEDGRMPEPVRVRTARVYDVTDRDGEARVLVDRLWPRGVRKETLKLDRWAKDVAPSNELRRWSHAHRGRWDEFVARYRRELADRREEIDALAAEARRRPLVLLYAGRDREHNQAVVLKEVVEEAAGHC